MAGWCGNGSTTCRSTWRRGTPAATTRWRWPAGADGRCDLARAEIRFSARIRMPRLVETPQTPPAHGNWGKELPVVYRWAYDYSVPGAPEDFIPQNQPGLSPASREAAS